MIATRAFHHHPRLIAAAVIGVLSMGERRASAQPAPAPPVLTASSQESPSPQRAGARLLRVGAQVGAAHAFAITMRTEAVNADGEFRAEMTMRQRLTSRAPNELIWEVETTTGVITSRGVFAGVENSLRQMNGIKVTKVTDVRGQTKSLAVGNRVMPSTGTPDITFPEQAVAPGETWTAEVEHSGRKATIRYAFKRVEAIGGRQVVIVEGVCEPGQFISTVAPLVFRLDAADCTVIDASGSMQMDMDGRIMRVTFTMTHQPVALARDPLMAPRTSWSRNAA